MYYVNVEQIEKRLNYTPDLIQMAEQLGAVSSFDPIHTFAMERVLHLAIEIVTDVGSYLIDGFIMRDASSYEDIIKILGEEHVFPDRLNQPLLDLVKLRKPLVQQYYQLDKTALRQLLAHLPDVLQLFSDSVHSYLRKEGG